MSSDIEMDQENSLSFDDYLHSNDEQKEKDLTPEKDQFSSDSDSDFIELQKNEIFSPKTKEEKQKQNEEIVISSSSSNFLPKGQENHYFIDASSLLDESEVTTYTSVTLREKPTHSSKITKLKTDPEEFTTEFEKEIKITNLEFKSEPSTSYDEKTTDPNDLPSSGSERSYISLNSQFELEKAPNKITWAEKNFSSLDSHILNTTQVASTSAESYASLDSHVLNITPKCSVPIDEKKSNFVRSGTFELDSDIRKNEKRQGTLIFQNSIHQYSGHALEPEPIIMPTTPFNSIIHVTNPIIPDKEVFLENIPKSDTIDSLSSLCEAQIKREDSVPIISGGILPSDCEIDIKDDKANLTKSEVKAAWVVDMSTPPPQKKTYSPEQKSTQKSSLGFFIDLTDVKSVEKPAQNTTEDIKKNIFSMSIEFQAPKKGMPSRLSQSLSTKKEKNDPKVEKKPKKDTNDSDKSDKIQFRHKRSNSNSVNRHSWNGVNEDYISMSHQRTFSLSEKMSEHTSLTIDFKNDIIHLEQVEICSEITENKITSQNGFDDCNHLQNGMKNDSGCNANVHINQTKNGYSEINNIQNEEATNCASKTSIGSSNGSGTFKKRRSHTKKSNGIDSGSCATHQIELSGNGVDCHQNDVMCLKLSKNHRDKVSAKISDEPLENEVGRFKNVTSPKFGDPGNEVGFKKHQTDIVSPENGDKLSGNEMESYEKHRTDVLSPKSGDEASKNEMEKYKKLRSEVEHKSEAHKNFQMDVGNDPGAIIHHRTDVKSSLPIGNEPNGKDPGRKHQISKNGDKSSGYGSEACKNHKKTGDEPIRNDPDVFWMHQNLKNGDESSGYDSEACKSHQTDVEQTGKGSIYQKYRTDGMGDESGVHKKHQMEVTNPKYGTEPIGNESKYKFGLFGNNPEVAPQIMKELQVQNNEPFVIVCDDGTTYGPTSEGFVSLSDLDKPTLPKVIEEPVYTRMTRSIPETSWIENKLLMSQSIGCRPSSKLLSNMSTSTPSFCFTNAHRISSESDVHSELSDFSSTALEISTDTSQSLSTHHHSNKLGTDLLRMFLEEISPDLTIAVAGQRLRAHKCILSSRCQYFAAMLSGGHVESTGNVISLDGFTFQAVYFAMCHIYSGAADIPENIDLVELATLADMLGLEGLKEVVATTLKLKYCHMFHKPCSVCVVGVIETLQLAFTYSLDDLYRKCLKWITRYFVRVWATRAFGSLPGELMEKCYCQHVVHMSGDNVLETMLCVDKLLATLPNVRWAAYAKEFAERLKEDCERYLMEHFASVLGSASFLSLGKELNWNISKLEGSFLFAAESLSPEQACRSYGKIIKLQTFLQTGDESWSINFTELVNNLYKRVESSVVRQAVRIVNTNAWGKIDPFLRARVQELACIPLDVPEKPPKSTHHPRSTSGSRNLDLRQIRIAMQQHTKRATSSESRVKIQEKKVTKVVEPQSQPPRPRTWPAQAKNKISSSESSRNSSPAMKNTRKPPPPEKTQPKVKTAPKTKVVNPPVKQHLTNSQKTIKLSGTAKSNVSNVKVQKTTNNPVVKGPVSKSGSNSSNQQSPSLVKNKQPTSSSNSTPSQKSKSDSNPYSGSPSLRRSLLLAAKSPQVPIKPMSPATNKRLARVQASNSLTSPTKASMAKCVSNKKNSKDATKTNKIESNKKSIENSNNSSIINNKKSDKPTVERSGTFLKDEPTVLNKA